MTLRVELMMNLDLFKSSIVNRRDDSALDLNDKEIEITFLVYESDNYSASYKGPFRVVRENRCAYRRVAGPADPYHLEKAKAANANRSFMRLAGSVRGPRNLSHRKGFSKS
jgi:hypothetical protein